MADGLTITNLLQVALSITAMEMSSCNSDDLKGTHVIPPGAQQSFDVSGHSGDTCHLVGKMTAEEGKGDAAFGLSMSDGNPAHIQKFNTISSPGIDVEETDKHNLVVK